MILHRKVDNLNLNEDNIYNTFGVIKLKGK
jgi:hypothetical protein